MFELIGLHKSFGPRKALDGFDLRSERGKSTVLLGPSGCGKSTALRVMIGLVTPDTGSVRFDGHTLKPAEFGRVFPQLRRRIGYVVQDGGLFPHLTARGNVCVMATHLQWDRDRIESRLGELVTLTRFPSDALDQYPVQLSGGQQQRVSLMRALMLDPDVLLLDEPLGALDPLIRSDLQTELKSIFLRLQKTVVLVTHDLAEAVYFADQIVLMRDGRTVQHGTADQLVNEPSDEFVTRFVRAQRGEHRDAMAEEASQ